MGHKEESRTTMEEETSPNEEVEITNETSATFYLYHPCSLLQKFLGTFFKCLGFEIESNKKEHDEVKSSSEDSEEDRVSSDDDDDDDDGKARNEHENSQEVLACDEQKECSTSTCQSFQLIRTLILRRGGPRISPLTPGKGGGIN